MPWKLVSCIIGIPTVGYKSTLLQYPNKSCSTILHRHSSQVWHKHVSPGGWLIKGVIHVASNTSVALQHRFRGSISVDRNDGFPYSTWPIWDDFVVPNLNHTDCRQSCIASALIRHFRHLRLQWNDSPSGPSERGGFLKLRRIPWNTPRNTIQPSYCDMGTLCQCSKCTQSEYHISFTAGSPGVWPSSYASGTFTFGLCQISYFPCALKSRVRHAWVKHTQRNFGGA